MEKRYTMDELIEIIHLLRKECPWDSVQTHASLKNCLIEECYEVLEALDSGNGETMADEMGDLLMQVLLHAEIGAEQGEYTLEDVTTALATKMIRRHPKIFDKENENPKSWDEIKKSEKKIHSNTEFLENISKYLPALQRSMKFSEKVWKWGIEEKSNSRYCEDSIELLRKIENKEDVSEDELGKLLYNISAICASKNLSGELILNNFLENFAKTLEK